MNPHPSEAARRVAGEEERYDRQADRRGRPEGDAAPAREAAPGLASWPGGRTHPHPSAVRRPAATTRSSRVPGRPSTQRSPALTTPTSTSTRCCRRHGLTPPSPGSGLRPCSARRAARRDHGPTAPSRPAPGRRAHRSQAAGRCWPQPRVRDHLRVALDAGRARRASAALRRARPGRGGHDVLGGPPAPHAARVPVPARAAPHQVGEGHQGEGHQGGQGEGHRG